MSDTELQLLHPPRRCGDGSHCSRKMLEARICEVALQQSGGGFLAGVVYECRPCDWKRVEPLRDLKPSVNGWTSSVSPCRRANDVQPR